MGKFFKHLGLMIVYFGAYQIATGFLFAGLGLKEMPELPPQLVQQTILVTGCIGLVLLTVLTLVLWKCVYPRKTVDYQVSTPWFQQVYWPVLLYLALLIFQWLVPTEASHNQEIVESFVAAYPVFSFFSIVVFAPLLEELIFRGFLATYFFPRMSGLTSALFYLLVTGSLFSLVHGPSTIPQFLVYFIMGLSFGWLYLIKRDIRYSMALHAFNNSLSFFLIVFLG